jgi:hypothetical protein
LIPRKQEQSAAVGPVCSPFLFGFQNLTNTKERIPAEEGETRTTYLNFLLSQRNQNIYTNPSLSLPKLVTNPGGKKTNFWHNRRECRREATKSIPFGSLSCSISMSTALAIRRMHASLDEGGQERRPSSPQQQRRCRATGTDGGSRSFVTRKPNMSAKVAQ